tara:strand:+ start:1624 stop:2487 length:864 start_codon:yes stop_codon:yes gene_type:complete
MKNKNGVIIIGSLHYDLFVNAFRQPKKGEIIVAENWFPKFGGKGGNQALASSLNGTPTKIVSAVGKDLFGQYILNKLKNSKVNSKFVQILRNEKTGISVAISDNQGEYGAVIVSGANLKINHDVLNNPSIWKNSKILMIQNEVDGKLNLLAAKKAKLNGLKVCLNASPPKKLNFKLIQNVDILIVNLVEAESISQKKIKDISKAKQISQILTKQFEIVVITAGEKGVIACEKNKKPIYVKAKKIKVKSTHGAGDVFAGVFCSNLALNKNIKTALEIANKKAAFHVAK